MGNCCTQKDQLYLNVNKIDFIKYKNFDILKVLMEKTQNSEDKKTHFPSNEKLIEKIPLNYMEIFRDFKQESILQYIESNLTNSGLPFYGPVLY